MTCLVYSESKDIPVDFWNYIEISGEHNKISYLSLNDAEINIINKRQGQGFFVKFLSVNSAICW